MKLASKQTTGMATASQMSVNSFGSWDHGDIGDFETIFVVVTSFGILEEFGLEFIPLLMHGIVEFIFELELSASDIFTIEK